MTSNPNSSDFSYKKYSLEQLDNWVNDSLNCDDLTPQDIYETILKCVNESVVYHKKYYTKSVELLSLLKGHRSVNFETTQEDWNDFWEETVVAQKTVDKELFESAVAEREYYEGKDDGMRPWGHSDLEYLANDILTKDRISNFPGEQYTEEEMNAMCERAATENDKEKCREYNLREAEYYNKRAQLDAEYNMTKADGYGVSEQ